MREMAVSSLTIHVAALEDPKQPSGRRHRWPDMVTIAVGATICGAENRVAQILA